MTSPFKPMQAFWQDSYLAPENESYLEDLYEKYLLNPKDVDPKWAAYFDQLLRTMPRPQAEVSHAAIIEEMKELALQKSRGITPSEMSSQLDEQQLRVNELISAYRRSGHLEADTDPLKLAKMPPATTLALSYYGLSDKDLAKKFQVGSYLGLGQPTGTLNQIYQSLRHVYCRTIGFEYMHINRTEEVEWIQSRIEQGWANFQPTKEEKLRILDRLVVADGSEKYLGFKYVGQKRFSLEGGDGLIPLLDTIISKSAAMGAKETVIGMAHRGRLNVLLNVVGKDPNSIFAAFEGKGISTAHSGDVKYHLGYSSNVNTPYGQMHVALAFNPSHLEIVAPVVQGSVRARQRRRRDTEKKQVYPIQIHGDAAFSSQGVVMETFSMSQARWFTVGGSIHIVINNQIGFTISDPRDARSTTYCTDSAKMIEAPILHVNGNDAEAVYFAALFALEYRQMFKKDVVIDLVCYRRHGHNEADEPSATQPLMYKVIKAMPVPYQIYAKKLIAEGLITEDTLKQWIDQYRNALDQGKRVVDVSNGENDNHSSYAYMANWTPFIDQPWTAKVKTAVPLETLKALGQKLTTLPDGFVLQPQVKKTIETKKKMVEGDVPLNWGLAETLAYATLLTEKYPIRLCGQDAARGTFAHRHAVLHDQNTDALYIPLAHLSEDQAHINVVDSLLSEEAVLAFEYGYATAEPNYLDIWEAQFGDFANGAQVVIDQFISSGEQKWDRLCGLVMLLPHGYEGQGPEHSSARLERYLQLCAQDNMQVCVPTTPAQIFHLLRRQMVRPYRKPLIVMSPKSLLRHPLATSSLKELASGGFQLAIPEIDQLDAKAVSRVVFCSGKIYYELLDARREQEITDIAIIRLEQLYPFPAEDLKKIMKPYEQAKDIVWCQEEPENQGSWFFVQNLFPEVLTKKQTLRYVGRPAAASPAVGYHSIHEKEQKQVVSAALMKRKM